MNNTEMASASHTTEGSTGGSSASSTGDSTKASRRPTHWKKWTREERAKICQQEIQDAFYLASHHKKIDEFMAEHFPNRTTSAIRFMIWQYQKKQQKFCIECGSKLS